jgi:glycosyltransferase involved in cell wall biosynthesis
VGGHIHKMMDQPASVSGPATSPRVRGDYSVSLVIPVRDESVTLESLLASIRNQTVPPDEVVFVDGGSTDDTLVQLHRAAERDAFIRIVEAQDATPGRGRNLGISVAQFDWIALTDAGIRLEPTWLERLLECLAGCPDAGVVFGNYKPITDNFFERCAAIAYVEPPRPTPAGLMRGPCVASSLLRRDVWQRAGGFPDLRATEDLIFIERVRQSGVKIAWAPGATVWWRLRPSLRETFRRFVLYSKHNVWAGRQRYWHYGVARQYVAAAGLIIFAAVHSSWWILVLSAAVAARVGKTIWRHRNGHGPLWVLNPARFILVTVILGTIDLATFVGWAHAIRHARSSASREAAGS